MDELIELIKSIEIRCRVIQLLYKTPDYLLCIPTILEDLYEDAQKAIIEFCVEQKDE